MSRLRRDCGFTLIELLFTVVIMGIITVPLGNFMLGYLKNFTTTQNRISDSHDIQNATAFFSQDAANTGVHNSTSPFALTRSSWIAGSAALPASYCGRTTGTLVLLLEWDTWTLTAPGPGFTGTPGPIYSVAYVTVGGNTLHRVYCQSTQPGQPSATTTSDTTIVHKLRAGSTPSALCPTSSAQCDTSTPPSTFSISLSISSGTNDQAAPANPVVLSGQRRQT